MGKKEVGVMEMRRNYPTPLIVTTVIILSFLLSLKGLDIDISIIFSVEGLRQIYLYFSGLFPPDLSKDFLREVFNASLETVAVSIMGTLFAVIIALLLTPFATRTLTPSGITSKDSGQKTDRLKGYVSLGSRLLLNILRSIPELVWAMVFILMVGLGPFAGVLALSFHTGGILGKLYADVLENVDKRPIEALYSTGAGRLKVLIYGVIPQALPQCISYTLYRWEMNIRAATILGFVGAGGIGLQFYKAISLFHGDRSLTLIIAVFIMVNIVDGLSLFLRNRVI